MMTVNEVSKLTGVSIRTLQYYDKIGLLKPTTYTESGYRKYDDMALEQLQQILLFRELEFPLKDIKEIMFSPNFDRNKALEQQIELLTMKKEHFESKLTGVSIRTLQYYDRIGLLKPTAYTESGYRKYDDTALEQLQQILLFRELEFPLKDIKKIMFSPNFDRNKALEQQIELLTMKKEHLENLITFARGIKGIGVKAVNFSAFDTRKIDEYAKQAKEQWGATKEYREFEEKAKGRTKEEDQVLSEEFMEFFVRFGQMKERDASDKEVQNLVKAMQDFITEHLYQCTNDILSCLGRMYDGGGDMTRNIDEMGGAGTASFAAEAIRIYCGK